MERYNGSVAQLKFQGQRLLVECFVHPEITLIYNEENTSIDYTEAFQKAIEDINMNEEFLVSSMYNFSLVSNEMEENFMNEFNRNEPLEDEEDEMEKGDEEDQ